MTVGRGKQNTTSFSHKKRSWKSPNRVQNHSSREDEDNHNSQKKRIQWVQWVQRKDPDRSRKRTVQEGKDKDSLNCKNESSLKEH